MNLQHADLFAPGIQEIHDLPGSLAGGTQQDNDALRVFGSVIVENVVIPASDPVDLQHVVLHNARNGVISAVVGLLGLIVDIGPLDGGTLNGMLRVHGNTVVRLQSVAVHQLRNRV